MNRAHTRRDESKPVRAKELPLWPNRVRWVLDQLEDDPYSSPVLPMQWVTALGEPRCVRCGWLSGAGVRIGTYSFPTCADCIDEVRKVEVVSG